MAHYVVYSSMPFISKTVNGRRPCSWCKKTKSIKEFSWHDKSHRYHDSRCRQCRGILRRQRYVPKRTVRQHSFANKHGTIFDDSLYVHLTGLECAYIAGLIDGEGCISSSQPRNNRNPLSIAITMVHRPTIEWLDEKLGGNFMRHVNKQQPARQAWTIQLKGARTYFLLKRLLPYMVTKQEEANIALDLGDSLFVPLVRGRVTEEVRARRAVLGQQLRDAKRREWRDDD